jgi:N-acyl-D-aspartate/D-glutamate deacylase
VAYDLLLRNGRVVDGSGMPAFWGDVGVAGGKIVEVGKLQGPARRVIDVQGQVIAPGFIDNHCHFDAQALWDPICTFACYHGATTVINGNCSLGMAPSRPDDHYAVVSMLSRVEAIPLASIQAGVQDTWETIPEYLALLDRRRGINVGALIGFSAVRRYVMDDAAYTEPATPEQIEQMKAIIRDGIAAGAIGLSFERNPTHHDLEGRLLPCNAASDDELVAVAAALAEVGAGTIQVGGNERNGVTVALLKAIALASGRPVICGLGIEPQQDRLDGYRQAMQQGARLVPMMPPFLEDPARWTITSVNNFDLFPTWRPIIASPPAEKKRAFTDPTVREKLRAESATYRWGATCVASASLPKNQPLVGRSVTAIAQEQGKEPLDAFLDLVLEEDLATVFMRDTGADPAEKGAFLANPHVMPGLSDGGAHVTRRCDSHFSTYMLSYWVREQQALTLEQAVQKLTFVPASAFGLHDRGMIRPGLAADIAVFDPDTVSPGEPDHVADFPAGAMRMRRLPQGVDCTIVNGEVLIEDGEHTGALPGKVVRSSAYQAHA